MRCIKNRTSWTENQKRFRVMSADQFSTSFAQQRLWFLEQYEPGTGLYNIPAACRINGVLRLDILERSLNAIIERHEALRTSFSVDKDLPVQVIVREAPVLIRPVKLAALLERNLTLQQFMDDEAASPFDLTQAPLIRATAIEVRADEHVLLLTLHHIVADGWSMSVLLDELSRLYNAELNGVAADLQALEIHYADYAVWQREWLQEEVVQPQLDYWETQLKDAPSVLELPTDRPRPARLDYAGNRVHFTLPAELGAQLQELSQRHHVTLFTTLICAFNTLLLRLSNQPDICIGYPVANRGRAEIQPLIGFFVNTLVLRSQMSTQQTFADYLQQTQSTLLDSDLNQDIPFERLVEALRPARELNHSPLFQVLFSFFNQDLAGGLTLSGTTSGTLEQNCRFSKFDLSLEMNTRQNTLGGFFEYRTALYDQATIERMSGYYRVLLESIVVDTTARIGDLEILPLQERLSRLATAPTPAHTLSADQCVHDLVLTQARATPDATAILCAGQEVSYRQLEQQATAIADRLIALGAGPETCVAICLDRSVTMVAALLGTWMAGAHYVPMDPGYPHARLLHMLQDSKARILLSERPYVQAFSAAAVQIVLLDEVQSNPRPSDIRHPVAALNTAYVIYTSGSTGLPKGVQVPHRAVVNFLLSMTNQPGINAGDRLLAVTSISFDISVLELFLPLISGASLVLADSEAAADGQALIKLAMHQDVTFIQATPSTYWLMLEAGWPSTLKLKVLCGGEALPPVLAQKLLQRSDSVWNMYGPTETTIWSAISRVTGSASTLGRPIANTVLRVLDENARLCATGSPGELHIGGEGVARGYLDRADLTAQKFVPDPYASGSGARIYKTGDLVRWLPNGEIEFLGRIDHQVKVRGFRIELGEIETRLVSFPSVRQGAVIVREDQPGDQQIVAYLLVGEQYAAEPVQLRHHLAQTLPGYMIPNHFVVLEQFPLTPNGKLDRKRLPAPNTTPPGANRVLPGTPMEKAVADIWQHVLNLEGVGITDNFFELGGHSILATQVVSRLRNTLQIELSVRTLFEAPTIAQLIASLGSPTVRQAQSIIPRSPSQHRQPLSYAQERLYFLDQFEPASAAYTIALALELNGPLEASLLHRCLDELIRRHEPLRTTFVLDADGKPQAQVHPEALSQLVYRDLRHHSTPYLLAQTQANAEAQHLFSLEKGPLFRASLLQTGEQQHILLLTLHHIVSDGWSVAVLAREVMALYQAFAQGQPSPLAPLDIQYGDYAAWQREWQAPIEFASKTDYWSCHLAQAPTTLELPTDRPRPAIQTYRGRVISRSLGKTLSARIDALSQAQEGTPFMTLLALFNVLLNRYSGQQDIVIGTPIANRTRPEIEPLIGLFVNTLAMRIRLEGNPTFSELLGQVRDTTLNAYAHQELPFEKVVESLAIPRDMSRSPLFQVLFVLQNTALEAMNLPGLEIGNFALESTTAKFDLTLELTPSSEGYQMRWEYNSDLFDADTIERMTRHFETLARSAISDPSQPAQRLSMITAQEKQHILHEWNATQQVYRPLAVHQLFTEMSEPCADLPAVMFGTASMSYRQLEARSNQFAHYLQRWGVLPGTLVGICLERSMHVPVAILAVLKAGAVCVPMDPSYPTERLRFMAQDARADLIITLTTLRPRVEGCSHTIICMDQCADAWHEPSSNPARPQNLLDLCYVIYTSGSTGLPKGAALTHEMLTNLVQWQLTESRLSRGDNTLQFSPLSFDVSFDEFFSTWASGGTLVMVSEDTRRDPVLLLELIQRQNIARLFIPFVALQGIADAARDVDKLACLKEVVCGGEQLQVTQEVVDLFQKLPDALLHNQYGPTESHFVTGYRLSGDATQWPALPPIGKPLFNSQMYVLDASLEPVPVGVRGDLYIAGVHLARCYWERPDITAERFVPNPHSLSPGARMYKTGDVARYLPDGNIEYLGRSDHQVKIRGFRIELAEVEQALMAQETVASAAAMVREDRPGLKKLVGYLVAKSDCTLNIVDIKEHLRRTLPDYMVPTTFVILPTLPLTPSGKVDKRSLPQPENDNHENQYVAPRSDAERQLAAIWASVLNLSQVGITDDFFELGGHSLLATQVVSRIRKQLNVDMALRTLFEAPTIEQLLPRLSTSPVANLSAITATNTGSGLKVASYAQERLFFLNRLDRSSTAYNIALALELNGPLKKPVLQQCLDELIRRHEPLRTTFALQEDGQVVSLVHPPQLDTLISLDLRHTAQPLSVAEKQVRDHASQLFSLETGPLLRVLLLQVADEHHILLFTVHHIIADGWSIAVLTREIMALYQAFSTDQASPLPPLEIQYSDYAFWQRSLQAPSVFAAQVGYWRQQLDQAPARLELPTDRPRPAIQTYRGQAVTHTWPPTLSKKIDTLSQSLGVTPFMTLLTLYSLLLSRHSGQRDIVVGTPIANRTRTEVEPLIGLFVNTLALRTRIEGNPTFRQLLQQVRNTTLGAYAHQDLPFEKVVEALDTPRDMSHSPLFQVMFVLQNTAPEPLKIPDVEVRIFDIGTTTAKFDLSLELTPTVQGYQVRWEYNCDLFDATTIERLAAQFQTLAESAVLDAQKTVASLDLLSASEKNRMLEQWNATKVSHRPVAALHHLFEQQVEQTPDAIAVSFEGQHLSYRALNEAANQLAHYLISRGTRADDLIAICMERSVEMVVSLLGVLKAGGAYVPIDPHYPDERIAYMLADAAPILTLTQRSLLKLTALQRTDSLCLDEHATSLAHLPKTNPQRLIDPACLAYCIYTSGSTGAPKGSLNSHEAIINRILWMQDTYLLDATDRVLQKTPFSFDVSVWEFFWPLSVGARMLLAKPEGHKDPRYLEALIEREGVTTAHFVPSMLSAYMALTQASHTRALRRVFSSGEALSTSVQNEFFKRYPATQLHNLYGPTEAAIDVTHWHCQAGDVGHAVPIGRPVANTRTYILDETLQPVPIGVTGNLYLAGVQLSRGYLKRVDLTAERFIPDPHGTPGSRMYMTGDTARYRAHGEIEYLGRNDQQIKLRGFRIELGEIEMQLCAHPQVSQAVVSVNTSDADNPTLTAYLVCNADTQPSVDELRECLARTLPDYMADVCFQFLDHLPLTSNGKVDRRALPQPVSAVRDQAVQLLAPRTALEKSVAAVWKNTLNLEFISLNDNFFHEGGHSLLAMKMIDQVNRELGLAASVRDIFESATLGAFIEKISQGIGERGSNRIRLKQGTRRHLFLVHAVGGVVSPYIKLSQLMPDDVSVHAFQAGGLEHGTDVVDTLEKMAAIYIEQMLEIQPEGPYWLGGWSMGGVIAFEMARQLEALDREVRQLLLIDAPAPGHAAQEQTWPLGAYLMDMARSLSVDLPLSASEMNQLIEHPDRDVLAIATMRRIGVIPDSMDDQQVSRRLQIFCTHQQALEAYRPKTGINSNLTLLHTEESAELRDKWRPLCGQSFNATGFTADHYSILEAATPCISKLFN
ncbi:amino acid adenylation domain-containing protein [Pseudomonas syringae pv. tomato]|uniref:Amino acid adenylation domain-containing protein n=4 Tax=Pseudomonas syringae group TaxID=136849 RepID=A0AAW4DS02_PSESX|nr:non-ribosomal peptide synthetase [Pseudomonas syringae pv. tomato]EEB62070.1 non-ribosomal peptide synthetase, terminal component [Pseudomonas syringae pv. tomato T1]MBI6701260.1 amino acid adenylation domain-containing protein [Pseudomonas syringae]MBH0142587.1 amino acid adenylation domain-containing protein [Pseudomonas syringae pv. tomato]MBI6712188.1 amino acid adenylation domain-containing protein [Pseudomonas syringae]